MTVLADWQIQELAQEVQMIEPFVDHVVSEEDGRRLLSYGLSSYGYDIRLSAKYRPVTVIQKLLTLTSLNLLNCRRMNVVNTSCFLLTAIA